MDKPKIRKDSPTKSASIKSEKANTIKKSSERKNVDQSVKKYAIVTPESVAIVGESIGLSDLSEEALVGLAEDVSYKLREVAHVSHISLSFGVKV